LHLRDFKHIGRGRERGKQWRYSVGWKRQGAGRGKS
jgi:hypothetical protein